MRQTHRRARGKLRWVLAGFAALALLIPVVALADTGHHDGFGGRGHHGELGGRGVLAQLTANPDCTLTVPRDPLSARGLASPYVLHSAGQACSEGDENLAAFVQATILTPGGQLEVFDPQVITAGDTPQQVAVPQIPDGSVITIWTGFNGNRLRLTGPGHRAFVNFAQQSYAGSLQFFRALREQGITPPALGTAKDGMTCPTTRDFSVVDQDQSDNTVVSYPAYGVSNGSDEGLMAGFIYPALGCTSWTAPVLDPAIAGTDATTTGPLQEAQAAEQAAPVALVPGLDPFVTVNGQPDLFLQNLYRRQVDQPPTRNGHDTKQYCVNLAGAVPRLQADATFETGLPPQFAAIAPTLAGVLKLRFEATWGLLQCTSLTGTPLPY